MNILFVHNNFPAQYRHIARELAQDSRFALAAIGSHTSRQMEGVRLLRYTLPDVDVSPTHPFARRFDAECRRAEEVLYRLTGLAGSGFVPDLVMAHPGWGETIPLRTVFPNARLVVYCEFFYGATARDLGFDPEFPESGLDGSVATHVKNAATLLALSDCDQGVSPTLWQRSTYPQHFHDRIEVLHDGVDTDLARPDKTASFRLPSGKYLTASDEVVTFVARHLEPLRGYHVFMRALPRILSERPHAQVVIIGDDALGYGVSPPAGSTWKKRFLDEVKGRLDLRRVHFVGRVPHPAFLSAMQISSSHVYLTYPFVLSWSILEAMAAGCVVIGSDTPPVREVLDDKNGILVPFFDGDQLADRVIEVLAHPHRFSGLRDQARQTVLDRYDLRRVCLPAMLDFIREERRADQRGGASSPRMDGRNRRLQRRAAPHARARKSGRASVDTSV